jgi:hypothetical protein
MEQGSSNTVDPQVALRRYYAAFDNPSQQGDIIAAGVPAPTLSSILSPADVGSAALRAFNNLGEVATAFPPTMEAGPVITTLAALLRAPRATAAAGALGERVLAKPTPEQTIARLQQEVGDLIERGKQFGIGPGPMPDVPLTPQQQINRLNFLRDDLGKNIAITQAEVDARTASKPPTSVPEVNTRPARAERFAVLDHLQSNPYVQSIPGRQGFPKKAEQIDLANRYFERGGKLNPGGPWGRDMQEEIRKILSDAARSKPPSGSEK